MTLFCNVFRLCYARLVLYVLYVYRRTTNDDDDDDDDDDDTQPPSQPPSHVAVAITLNAQASSLKITRTMTGGHAPMSPFGYATDYIGSTTS